MSAMAGAGHHRPQVAVALAWRIALAVFVVALGFALSSSPARAAFPGKNGKIAYMNGHTIWLMNADGSRKHQIARVAQPWEGVPRWSPNGRRIAYSSDGDIWLMNADGSGKTRLTTASSYETSPAWSPDGKWVIFASDRQAPGQGRYALYKLRSTKPYGSVVTVVSGAGLSAPTYAANGSLAYLLEPDLGSSGSCCLVKTLTNSVRHTLYCCDVFGYLNWGPASRVLGFGTGVWNGEEFVGSRITTVKSDGSGLRFLHRAGDTYFYDANPAWAPAGTWLVFDEHYSTSYDESSSPATERGIWKMRGDGTGRVRLSTTGTHPDWQPLP